MLNTDLAKKYAKWDRAKKQLEAKARLIGKKLDGWSPTLIDHMIDEEIDKISLKGGLTLSLQEMIWAKIEAKDKFGNNDKPRIVAALRQAQLDDLVTDETYNSNALSYYLRELDRNDEKLPEELVGIVRPNPVQKIVVKKLT